MQPFAERKAIALTTGVEFQFLISIAKVALKKQILIKARCIERETIFVLNDKIIANESRE